MSTSTLGGHVSTTPEQAVGTRRRRRKHSDEFKANAVASCMHPGMSMAAVAMTHGINANLLRRWVHEAELGRGAVTLQPQAASQAPAKTVGAAFIPMQLPAPGAAPAIRIELRRGTTAINVSWPTEAAEACAVWMRELLR